MNKKSILAAIFLIFIGIVFGVLLVSNFRFGVDPAFAGDPQVKLGAPTHLKSQGGDYKALSRAFIEVSKAVSPTVVSITVISKGKSSDTDLNRFFRFFGPNPHRDTQPEQEGGSGVVISPEGYILTNYHVIADADEHQIDVAFSNDHRLKAKIVGSDPTTDLAVLKVSDKDLPTVALGNSDDLEIGEWVLAIGNPLGLRGTITAGIVSALGRNIGIIEGQYRIEDFIQTDAAINPGNSGGPLVNLNGEVVGINAAIASDNARYQGYGFAIPINLARTVAEDIIKTGKVQRGYLNVGIGPVDEALAKALGLSAAKGVMIQSVEKGGAADAAGVQEKDVVLEVDGKEVDAPADLQTYVARKHPGDQVVLKVFRDGKTIEKKVTLRPRSDEKLAVTTPREEESTDYTSESHTKTVSLDKIGLTVRPLTKEEKKQYSLEGGVIVADAKFPGEAFNRGLRSGDVILEADRKTVNSPKDLQDILQGRKPGDFILLRIRNSTELRFLAMQIPE
jgi:serine protease Do